MGTLGFYFLDHFIAYYGLMIVTGIAAAALIAYVQIKKKHLSQNDFILIAAISGLSGIVGAKILYLMISAKTINPAKLTDLSYINELMSGGFVFLGGLLGVFPALYFCKKKLKINVAEYLQHCTGCIPIAHGFGRIGCYLVGCCHGIPYDGRFSVVYSNSLYAPNGVRLLPVQLLEAFGELTIGLFLLCSSKKRTGLSAIITYVILYSGLRFFLEYLRGDLVRGSLYGFSTSQLISFIIFVMGLGILLREKRKKAADRLI